MNNMVASFRLPYFFSSYSFITILVVRNSTKAQTKHSAALNWERWDECRETVPVALETGAVLVGWRQMASQTDCGAEELRRTFSLERCLAFQQNLR